MRIHGPPPTSTGRHTYPTNPLLALSTALIDRDEDASRALLARSPAVAHAVDGHGNGALHLAVHAGASANLVQALLQAGVDVLRVNGDGNTALHIAAGRSPGDPETISALLSAGGLALVDRTDRQGHRALERARRHGSTAVVERLIADIHLLERCADWRASPHGPLWEAFVEALPDASPNAAPEASMRTLTNLVWDLGGAHAADGRGMTVLMRAAASGCVELVAWLIEQGAPVNAICHCERTGVSVSALMCGLAFPEVTRLLIAWGADPTQRHRPATCWLDRPQTVLHVAAMQAAPDAMAAVLGTRRRREWDDADLGAALLSALRDGVPQRAFALLEYSGKLDARTMREAMPLAVATGSHELVHLLLALGADVNARDAQGRTVLANAEARGDDEMAMLLSSRGAAATRPPHPRARSRSSEGCLLQ